MPGEGATKATFVSVLLGLLGTGTKLSLALALVVLVVQTVAVFRTVPVPIEEMAAGAGATGAPGGTSGAAASAPGPMAIEVRYMLTRIDSLLREYLTGSRHDFGVPDPRLPDTLAPVSRAGLLKHAFAPMADLPTMPEAVLPQDLKSLQNAAEYVATLLGRRVAIRLQGSATPGDGQSEIHMTVERSGERMQAYRIRGRAQDVAGLAAATAYLALQPAQSELSQLIVSPAALWELAQGLSLWLDVDAAMSPQARDEPGVGVKGEKREPLAEPEVSLRRAVSLAPRDTLPRLCLGMLLARMGRGDEAVAALREAIFRCPDCQQRLLSSMYLQLGCLEGDAADRHGDPLALARCVPSLRNAVRLEPGNAGAWLWLGNAHLMVARSHVRCQAHHFTAARQAFARAGRDRQHAAQALDGAGLSYYDQAATEGATGQVACLQAAVAHSVRAAAATTNPAFANNAACFALELARVSPERASGYRRLVGGMLTRLLDVGRGGMVESTYGEALTQMGMPTEALPHFLQAWRANPNGKSDGTSFGEWLIQWPGGPNVAAALIIGGAAGSPGSTGTGGVDDADLDALARDACTAAVSPGALSYSEWVSAVATMWLARHTPVCTVSPVRFAAASATLATIGRAHRAWEPDGPSYLEVYRRLARAVAHGDPVSAYMIYLERDPASRRLAELAVAALRPISESGEGLKREAKAEREAAALAVMRIDPDLARTTCILATMVDAACADRAVARVRALSEAAKTECCVICARELL